MRHFWLGLIAIAGCSAPVDSTCTEDGQFDISWTIRGAPAATGCTGIDHLDVEFDPDACTGGVITPVLCTEGKMIYRNLPRGPSRIQITAYDASGFSVASGATSYDIEPGSTTISPIDLE